MLQQELLIPDMPRIGEPESHYSQQVRRAERRGDSLSRDGNKVGQYISLALAPALEWSEKLRFFQHTLRKHCVPPPFPDEEVWLFYQQLADLVRDYAGAEALRIASTEDDLYDARRGLGADLEKITNEAELFFGRLVPREKPSWLNDVDYEQLKLIRDQWI